MWQNYWELFRRTLSKEEYLYSFLLFVFLSLGYKYFRSVVLKKIEQSTQKTKTDWDDQLVVLLRSIGLRTFTILSFLISIKRLESLSSYKDVINAAVYLVVVWQLIKSSSLLIDYVFSKLNKKGGGEKSALTLIKKLLKLSLWVLFALLALQNLGVNVTSIVAGLGVGGVAVAFALQNILADIFSSFALIFDKPFEKGDFIVVGDYMGVVEKIGIKTTRMRALQGEEIVISNQELTSSRIQNFKKMKERRVSFKLGIGYNTKIKMIKKINEKIKVIVEEKEKARLDRVHLHELGDSALILEIVYYVQDDDYNVYMDIHQEILINILEYLEKVNVEVAYPTSTVYLRRDS